MWFQLAHAQLLKFRGNCFFSYRPAGGCPAFNSLSLSFGGEDILNGEKIKFADDNFVKASNLAQKLPAELSHEGSDTTL